MPIWLKAHAKRIYIITGDPSMLQSTQLPLNLHLRDDAIFESYVQGSNEQVLHHLQTLVSGNPIESYIYCYGDRAVGQSHLLQACCHALSLSGEPTFYLPLEYHNEISPDILTGLEAYALVCIDDIHQVTGIHAWEEALFHFFNRIRDAHGSLLVSANVAPRQLNCGLPDLKTRLASGLALQIHDLTDAEKMHALKMRARNRGLVLSDEVIQYLMRHYSRNMGDLFSALDKLDRASLAAKRKITVPFLKMVLGH